MKIYKYLRVLLFLIVTTVMVQSCSKNAEPRFYVDIERDFNVENSLGAIVTHIFELKNIPTKLDQNLSLFSLAEENITIIGPSDATLTTASGLMDWSLVNFVEIYAVSRIDPSNKKRIFFINQRDSGNIDALQLFNTFADLSDIMVEETIDLEVRLRTIIPVPGNFRARLIFNYAVFDEI